MKPTKCPAKKKARKEKKEGTRMTELRNLIFCIWIRRQHGGHFCFRTSRPREFPIHDELVIPPPPPPSPTQWHLCDFPTWLEEIIFAKMLLHNTIKRTVFVSAKSKKKIFLFILIHCLIISIFPWRDLQPLTGTHLIINHTGHNLLYWLHEWCRLSSIQTTTNTRWSMQMIIFDLTHRLMTKELLVFNNSPI